MKKLINEPRAIVREMLEGLCDLHPGIALHATDNVVVRSDLPPPAARAVAVLSGGGSGHEPAHGGYVGAGMLSAAVAGEVFTSPSVDSVLAAIRAASGPTGAVLVVKNYTGDRLNFGLAAELARGEGIPVEEVIVADDVALRDVVPASRRRGIAGTVLVHKIAGAAAETGRPLAEVADLARAAAADLGSMGVALGPCTVPAAGRPGFELGADEIELGLGIHGEPGVERTAIQSADALVERLLDAIVADLELSAGERVALLVNGLGATPPMELAVVARAALARARGAGLIVERAWSGTLLSALEMPGASLSLLRVDDERLGLLDAPTTAPSWPGSGRISASRAVVVPALCAAASARRTANPAFGDPLRAIAQALEDAEAELTRLDSAVGDGDLGISMRRAADAMREMARSPGHDAGAMLSSLATELRRVIGGSSGPFYATALLRAARDLPASPAPADWAHAFQRGVAAVRELGGAAPGDCTMVDALVPASKALDRLGTATAIPADVIRAAADAAERAARATTDLLPKLGRASYMGARAQGVPDPGAMAVAVWLRGLARHFS